MPENVTIASVAAAARRSTIEVKALEPSVKSAKSAYRRDIDGLRAIAVVIVVIYHTGIAGFRGGFVGVDVFFVISGFLITSLLRSELESGTFNISRFYERRVRRIFPALVVVIATSLVVAPFVLFPVELKTTALTGFAAISSFSNIYLLNSAGYFGADVNSQPLIHTWSLGVEEQFYLAFPLLLIMIGAVRARIVPWIIAGAALISLFGGILMTIANRDIAYYFPLTRAWELLAGSLLAYFTIPLIPRMMREVAMAVALALLVACAIKFHSGLSFPGYIAVLPCLGAATLISVGGQGPTIVKSLLSSKPFIWIGKISYSLYLWHWPIFVFYQLVSGRVLSTSEAVGLMSVSIVAAYLSWRYIEQPFRERKVAATQTQLWRWAGIAYLTLCIIAAVLYGMSATAKLQTEANRLAGYINYNDTPVYRRGTCFLLGHRNRLSDYDREACLKPSAEKLNILLMGDSHAADLWSGLHTVLAKQNVMQATSSGCKPVIAFKGERGCTDLMRMVFDEFLKTNHTDTLVISARWIQSDIPDVVETLRALRGSAQRIVVFGPIVEYQKPLSRLLAQVADGRDTRLLLSARSPEQLATDKKMQAAVNAVGGIYVSAYSLLCPPDGTVCTTQHNGVPVQWDYGHLTAEGSLIVAERAKDLLLGTR